MDFIKRWFIFQWNALIIKIYYFSNKLIKNIPDPCNGKEDYQSFIIKKNKKSGKQSDKNTYQPETFDTVDIKSFTTKHANTSHKLSRTIRQAQKLDSNRSLYSGRKKVNFFERKKFNKNKTGTWI